MCRMSIPRTAVVGVKDPTTYILRVFVSIKFFSVPRDGTGTDNIPRRLLTTLPNSGSLHLYLSIRRYSDFRDRDSLDLESRLERHLCVRSYEFSSSRLRTGLVVYNSSRFHRIKLLRHRNHCGRPSKKREVIPSCQTPGRPAVGMGEYRGLHSKICGDSTGSQQLNIGAQPVSWKKARLATWCND
jgi:hypothetical protein